MAVLTIRGRAEKEFHYDLMTITVTFCTRAYPAAMALDSVMNQCEDFLAHPKRMGMEISELALDDNEVEYIDRRESDVTAKRGIKIHCGFDMNVLNAINRIIADEKNDVMLHTEYSFSNERALRQELKKEAIENSRQQAELACSVTGQHIKGIKKIDMDDDGLALVQNAQHNFLAGGIDYLLSGELQSPTKKLCESVVAVWEIE